MTVFFDPSTSTALIKKGKQSKCIPLWQLQIGEPLNCLTVEPLYLPEDRTILRECDDTSSEQKWSLIESGNSGIRICRLGSNKCLTYDPKGIVGPEISLMKRNENAKTQLFKMNIKTGQFVIVDEPRSCMVGVFRSYSLESSEGVQKCDEKNIDNTYKKWYIVPLKNCQ